MIKPECIDENGSRKTRHKLMFFRKYRRFGAYMAFRREFEEYVEQARKSAGRSDPDLPIAKVFGLVETSLGLGLVVEKVRDSSGQHIVCIDGTGDKSVFKLYSLSRYFNGLKLDRYHRKVLGKMARAMQSVSRSGAVGQGRDEIKLAS